MSETAAVQRPWIEGKNGGRLRPGGTRGPNKTTVAVRNSVLAALEDKRGGSGKEFWVGLKTGSAEDKRVFAQVCARVITVEVSGGFGEALTVMVQTLVAAQNGEPIPSQGTCVIGENAPSAPMPTPITVKTDEVGP